VIQWNANGTHATAEKNVALRDATTQRKGRHQQDQYSIVRLRVLDEPHDGVAQGRILQCGCGTLFVVQLLFN